MGGRIFLFAVYLAPPSRSAATVLGKSALCHSPAKRFLRSSVHARDAGPVPGFLVRTAGNTLQRSSDANPMDIMRGSWADRSAGQASGNLSALPYPDSNDSRRRRTQSVLAAAILDCGGFDCCCTKILGQLPGRDERGAFVFWFIEGKTEWIYWNMGQPIPPRAVGDGVLLPLSIC